MVATGRNEKDDKFDQIVGALQEVLMEDEFDLMQRKFCHKNCMEFEATEENKLSYTPIFKEY